MSAAGVCHSSLHGSDGPIVDDHAGFRAAARGLLEAGGFDVLGEAADGTSALAAVAKLQPEIVLLDVQLPDLDGFAVAERLASDGVPPSCSSRAATCPRSDAGWPRIALGASSPRASSPEKRSPPSPADGHAATPTRTPDAGIAAGLLAEWASYDVGELGLTSADLAVGWVLIGCGFVAWERRPESHVGAIMSLAGFTWFLGTAFEQALYLHRGPFVHLLLSYPTGRVPTRLVRAVVVAAYVDGAIEPLARNDILTLALSGAVAGAALWGFLQATGPARRAAGLPLAAAFAFAAVLALGAAGRLRGSDPDLLWAYSFVIAFATIALVIDLLRARWAEAVVTELVVDLGARQETATLRGKLARALGDPSLVVGYLPATGALVDEAGRTVHLPSTGSGREVTSIAVGGHQIAVLVHDEALLADRKLLESVAAAAQFAVANAALQAEARSRADELEASRRRIVEAGDSQRRRLEQELRLGAERRLDRVAMLMADARNAVEPADGASIGTLEAELDEARRELREFAQACTPLR